MLDDRKPMITAPDGAVSRHRGTVLLTKMEPGFPRPSRGKPHCSFGIVPDGGVLMLWPHVVPGISPEAISVAVVRSIAAHS